MQWTVPRKIRSESFPDNGIILPKELAPNTRDKPRIQDVLIYSKVVVWYCTVRLSIKGGVYAKSKIDIGIQPSQQTHQHTPSIPKNSPPLPSPSPSPSPTFLSIHVCMPNKTQMHILSHSMPQSKNANHFSYLISSHASISPPRNAKPHPCSKTKPKSIAAK